MTKTIIVIIALIIVGGGIWFLGANEAETPAVPPSPMPTDGAAEMNSSGSNNSAAPAPKTATVRYTDTGYSPASITVQSGTTVTFVNESSGPMWTASDVHPTHRILSSFDPQEGTGPGETYSYTFNQSGTWRYHNHLKPGDTGAVSVK